MKSFFLLTVVVAGGLPLMGRAAEPPSEPAPVVVPLPPSGVDPAPVAIPDILPGPDALPGPEALPTPESPPPAVAPPAPVPAPSPAAPPPAAPAPPPAPARATDPIWADFDRAFNASAQGHEDEAIPILRRLVLENPGHLVVPQSRELLKLIETRLTGPATAHSPLGMGMAMLRPPDRLPPPRTLEEFATRMRAETPTNSGQVTLVLGQTVNGLTLGLELCFALGCTQPIYGMIGVLTGAGLGATLSLVLSGKGVTAGHALALMVGPGWGALNAGLAMGMFNDAALLTDGGNRTIPLGIAVGQSVGTVIGEIAYQVLHPGDGDVWAAVSMSGWAMAVTALGKETFAPQAPSSVTGVASPDYALTVATIIAADMGLILGGVIGMVMPMSSGRVWIINAGGVLGSLGGLLVSAVIVAGAGSSNAGSIVAASTGIGILFGLVLTGYISRNLDVPAMSVPQVALIPTSTGGITPGLAMRF